MSFAPGFRPSGGLRAKTAQRPELPPPVPAASLDILRGWRWRLQGGDPIPLFDVLTLGEAARRALGATAKRLNRTPYLPDCLHGSASSDDRSHGHAFYLPEDADGDGVFDHLLVFAGKGLTPDAIALLACCTELRWPDRPAIGLHTVWVGDRTRGGGFGPHRRWVSCTAYVTPRRPAARGDRVRDGLSPANQIAAELTTRALPVPSRIEIFDALGVGGQEIEASTFRRQRQNKDPREAAGLVSCFALLEFDQPLQGPLALGYGCHFGLGQFVPATAGLIDA